MSTAKKIENEVRTRFMIALDETIVKAAAEKTITEIMTDIGDHQQSLSLLRSGRRFPTVKNIVLICQLYGYNESWILFGESPKKKKINKGRTIEDRLKAVQEEFLQIIGEVKKKV